MNNGRFPTIYIFFFKEWSKEISVFEAFNESVFALNQTMAFSSFGLIDWNNFSVFFPYKNKFVSSANMAGVNFEEALNKPFTWIRSNTGPKIETCSTPHFILL